MRKRFVPDALGLEERVVLSTTQSAIVENVIPFVRGQRQNALNFTSHTYWQIVKGGPTDLEDIADDFKETDFRNSSKELRNVLRQLDKVAKRVPYGRQELLPVWLETLQDSVGLDKDTIESRLRRDLQVYVNSGVGSDWNIIKSSHSHSTDSDLIFTGSVYPGPVVNPL